MRFAAPIFAVLAVACGGGSSPAQDAKQKLAILNNNEQPAKLVEEGKAYAALGDTTRAEQYFSMALNRGADESVVVPLIVKVCVRDGRYELAIDYASRYAQKHPS